MGSHIILGLQFSTLRYFLSLLTNMIIGKVNFSLPCGYSNSALYVVDLVKFRQTAAGDTLRVFYETLSKDPNSLSNLDQVKDSEIVISHAFALDMQSIDVQRCSSYMLSASKNFLFII